MTSVDSYTGQQVLALLDRCDKCMQATALALATQDLGLVPAFAFALKTVPALHVSSSKLLAVDARTWTPEVACAVQELTVAVQAFRAGLLVASEVKAAGTE